MLPEEKKGERKKGRWGLNLKRRGGEEREGAGRTEVCRKVRRK